MDRMVEELAAGVERWDREGWPRPRIMVVSGSGLAVDLGSPAERRRPLAHWLPFEIHGIEGHPLETELLLPQPDRPVWYQKGRLHSYQGYDAHQIVFSVRLGRLLGVETLILTNAAGGLRRNQRPGDLALLRDQINLIGINPLRGELPAQWGPRFPDMGEAYDPALRRIAAAAADRLGLDLDHGVYAGVAGPSYETPAEVRMLRSLGADLVGMSTVLEVIAARQMGVRCLGLSLVSNLAPEASGGPVTDHEEVLAAGRAAAGRVQSLLRALLVEPELVAPRR